MTLFSRIRLLGLIFGLMALVACDTAEERAEGHYQRGMQLLADGKTEQALLEFKNALQLNEDAIEPRLEFARIRMKQGEFRGALGNYLKVIELDENHLEARTISGRLLLQFDNDPQAAREHIDMANTLAPEDEEVRALVAALAQKEERPEDAAELAQALLQDAPGNATAVGILVAQEFAARNFRNVVALTDTALAANPDELSIHVARLQALEQLQDQPAIGVQLQEMAKRFPDNAQIGQGRVQWFLNQRDANGAISAQRTLAKTFAENPNHALGVVSLLNRFEGPETARGELMALADSGDHIVVFNRALADFEQQQGNGDVAVTILDKLLTTDLAQADKHGTQAQLANILRTRGDTSQALELAEEILANEPDHVDALKLRAWGALDDDRPHSAISDLRAALNVRAQDPSILMMLALAHERNGSPTLAQERLALAVQASGNGVIESLRYAEFLGRQDKATIAQGILEDALTKHGELTELLAGLGQIQLSLSDWNGARDTVARLARINDPRASRTAQELQVAVLNGEQRIEQSIGVLREMWDASGESTSAMENLVGNYIRAGKSKEAAEFLDDILIDDVANMRANLLRGAVHVFDGEFAEAETRYRKVIEDHPEMENGYGALANLLARQGHLEDADAVIAEGIAKAQNADRLLFTQASRLEEAQDFEGALAIYEQLYQANRLSDVLANNYAALLSDHRDDPDSLERAYNVAKRLRASEEPAFQDTYGWILYKRGEYELALPPLEQAAKGAANNAYVQFHLGMVYSKLGKKDLAIAQLTKTIELGQGANLPIIDEAKAVLETLQNG